MNAVGGSTPVFCSSARARQRLLRGARSRVWIAAFTAPVLSAALVLPGVANFLAAQPPPGNVACAACHPSQVRAHAQTLMAKTLQPAAGCDILINHPDLQLQLGDFRYRIRREGNQSIYSVTHGSETFAAPIRWAVGQGEAGQTYLIEYEGRLWESRVSFYNDINGLDVTIGAPPGTPKNLMEAVGRVMSPRDVVECLSCHAATSPPAATTAPLPPAGSLAWTLTLQHGVQCGSCHKNVWKHADSLARPGASPATPHKLKNATSEEINDLCGACHRTWEYIQINGPRGVANVRFQPYRIVKSKCYDAVDARISCVACHDPHARDVHRPDPAVYDRACLACHAPSAGASRRQCRVGRERCAGCHMPKYEIPGSHFRFTDHMIRVVREYANYPD